MDQPPLTAEPLSDLASAIAPAASFSLQQLSAFASASLASPSSQTVSHAAGSQSAGSHVSAPSQHASGLQSVSAHSALASWDARTIFDSSQPIAQVSSLVTFATGITVAVAFFVEQVPVSRQLPVTTRYPPTVTTPTPAIAIKAVFRTDPFLMVDSSL